MRTTKRIIYTIAAVLMLSACSAKTDAKRAAPPQPMISGNIDLSADKERVKAIEDAIKSIDGIIDARAVITGNTAIIGIETENQDRAAALKREAEKRAKAADTAIDHATVTTSKQLLDRIKRMKGELPTPEPNLPQTT